MQSYDEAIQRSALEERQRLARELHDSVGQVLGYVSFQTDAARELYANGKAEDADKQLRRLAAIAQDAHADVREYILNLRTTPTARESLFITLQNYLNGFTRNYNIQTQLLIKKEMDGNLYDPKTQLSIFRIVQEALSNVRKHADAHHVTVTIDMDDERLYLSIEDDGHGFDLESTLSDRNSHFGLSFMNERVEQLSGSIRFEAVKPSGTRVFMEIPINKELTI
jgi:signal transduction histidine kinase